MTYEDLLIVPYKENGRDENGMDCYGFVIELLRRAGKKLPDLAYLETIPEAELYDCVCSLGLIERGYPEAGLIAQWVYDGTLHVGYMVNKKTVVHMTFSGVRVTPIGILSGVKYFEVE